MLASMKKGYRSLRSWAAAAKKKRSCKKVHHNSEDPFHVEAVVEPAPSKEMVDHSDDPDVVVQAGEMEHAMDDHSAEHDPAHHDDSDDDDDDDDTLSHPSSTTNTFETVLRLEVTGFSRDHLHLEVDLTHAKLCLAGFGRGRMFKRTFPIHPTDNHQSNGKGGVDVQRLQATWVTSKQGRHFVVVMGPWKRESDDRQPKDDVNEDGSSASSSSDSTIRTRRQRLVIQDTTAEEHTRPTTADNNHDQPRSFRLPTTIYVPADAMTTTEPTAPVGLVF